MVVSLLSTFSSLVRQGWSFIRQGVRRGLSGNAIIGALRAGGLGGRNEQLRTAIRYARELLQNEQFIRSLDPRTVLDERILKESATTLRRRFSYLAEVEGKNLQTGQRIIQRITVSSDDALTRAEIEQAAEDIVMGDEDRYSMEVTAVGFQSGVWSESIR